jgi:small subunit ribosomal protein S20
LLEKAGQEAQERFDIGADWDTVPVPNWVILMPNTKSAERRVRSSARKHQRNRSVKAELKTLEKSYLGILSAGNKEQAAASLRSISSALDKAAKTGIIHSSTASRKKSRLAARLRTGASAQPTSPAAAPVGS